MGSKRWRGTTFGGRNDLYDLAYAPGRFYARLPGETPAQYYERIPAWMKAYFVPSMATTHTWPVEKAWLYRAGDLKNKVSKSVKVGLSWFLNSENVDFFAFHRADSHLRSMALQGRAWLRVTNDQGVTVEGRIVDHGPSGGIGNDLVDMSEHAHKTLSCDGKTKNIVSVELFFT